MKKVNIAFGFLFVFLLTGLGAAAAQQSVSGRVTEINTNNQTVIVQATEPVEGVPQRIELEVGPDARLEGFSSLQELSVGDDIRFEGTPGAAGQWQAQSVESLTPKEGEAGGSSVTDFFQSVKQQIQSTWYSLRYNIEPDKKLYLEQTAERIQTLDDRLKALEAQAQDKSSAPQETQTAQAEFELEAEGPALQEGGEETVSQTTQEQAERPVTYQVGEPRSGTVQTESALDAQESLNDAKTALASAQTHIDAAKQNIEILKQFKLNEQGQVVEGPQAAATEPGSEAGTGVLTWDDVRANLEDDVNEARSSINEAAEVLLTEKEVYVWEKENQLKEMEFNIEQIEARQKRDSAETSPAGETEVSRTEEKAVQEELANLKDRQKQAEQQLQQVREAGKDDAWRSMKPEVDRSMDELRNAYFSAVAKTAG